MDGSPMNRSKDCDEEGYALSQDSDLQDDTASKTSIFPIMEKTRKAAKRASSMPSASRSPLTHSFQPLLYGHIRLVRLLPHRDKRAPIQCHLLDHFLLDPDLGDGSHPYEALSYVWGSPEKCRLVYTEEGFLTVARNLYSALIRLRDRKFSRIIWADGICINQDDLDERACQVKHMAMVYAKATRVIVWLEESLDGDITTNGDQALEAIRISGLTQSADHIDIPSQEAILTLLHRSWFERIWVLQEISAARHTVVMSCSKELEGSFFCLGLKKFSPMLKTDSIRNLVSLFTYLLVDSNFSLQTVATNASNISFNIAPLGQLIDMYCTQKATDRRDKIFALLGMSSHSYGISADYNVSWKDLSGRFLRSVIGQENSVDTHNGGRIAFIRAKGFVIGTVTDIPPEYLSTGEQRIRIKVATAVHLEHRPWDKHRYNQNWSIHTTAKTICKGDIVCIFRGASRPAIIRRYYDHCALVATSIAPTYPGGGKFQEALDLIQLQPGPLLNFLLVWDWEESPLATPEDIKDSESFQCQVLDPLNIKLSNFWDRAARLHIMGLMLLAVNDHDFWARDHLLKIIELYERKSGTEVPSIPYPNILVRQSDGLGITETDVIEIVSEHDPELLKFLLDQKGNEVQITRSVFEAAAANPHNSPKIFQLLLDRQIAKIVVTKRMLVNAIQNHDAQELVTLLLNQEVTTDIITEEVMIIAIKQGKLARLLIPLLLNKQDNGNMITEKVLEAAVCRSDWAKETVPLLLETQHSRRSITEKVLLVAARQAEGTPELLTMLLARQDRNSFQEDFFRTSPPVWDSTSLHGGIGHRVNPITEEVLLEVVLTTATSHSKSLRLFMGLQLDKSIISERVLIAATHKREVIERLIEYGGDQIPMSKKVFQEACEWDTKAAKLLFDRYKHQFSSTLWWSKLEQYLESALLEGDEGGETIRRRSAFISDEQ
ncbi:hypothetical protein NPX13_g4067 [Xylaria arbuscula]|uniref:Heterokaryon incompatibility domain-containing protein n=1 Tax=Xylaria arbuscula TaxID=114810 RepID=A0A9W8NH18_9PEZI|nr:hypothetical protein NPX13_g4067 [Xylaria arbuscula]